VEDEEAVRDLVRESLQQNGYTVLEAKDGTEALQISKRYKDPIHLLLTDVIMPGMNGRELAQGLASSHPDMKVLYMSGYTENAVVHDGVLDSGMALLQKPFTRDQLAKRVRELLDGDRRTTTKCK
jgi:CheY-like chemotaxis protein